MIELKNITYIVQERGQDKVVLDNVSCVFDDKCVTAITGHNGSGKSTLTKIIMGMITPTSGRVSIDGVDVTDMTIDERARMGVNYAFQQPITFRGITVKDLIDIATGENNSVPKACDYLSKVGICAKEYIDRDFDKTLSGGEQKRIELALSLAKKGKYFIFDEPEAGIDLWSFDRLNSLFDRQKSYIVVSHQEKLLNHADKILVMKDGKISDYGDGKKIMKSIKGFACAKIGGKDGAR
ncbi:MAG: ATP-binding cassette domain-containing protein [Clostridiales bacterium]|nr:ATP-binding cassette domain-containing protein [Clostridiales bacterium]